MKKILFISPTLFDYYEIIVSELEERGYFVKWYSDRPSDNFFTKALIRINRNLIGKAIDKYVKDLIEDAVIKQYDVVLIILGESFNKKHIEKLRLVLPKAQFIYYLWDSLVNFPKSLEISYLFDKCYTFDPYDAQKYNHFKHLALFYSKDYKQMSNVNKVTQDIFYVGTANKGKFLVVKHLARALYEKYPNQNIYFYMHSKIFYYYSKIKYREFKNTKVDEFNYKKLEKADVIQHFMNARIILDAPKKDQLGLTMRTIEALGASKKLITTNSDIVKYDFYKPENIYVYDGNTVNFDDIFFNSEYHSIEQSIYEKYSIENWVKKLME